MAIPNTFEKLTARPSWSGAIPANYLVPVVNPSTGFYHKGTWQQVIDLIPVPEDSSDITNVSSVTGATVTDALNWLLANAGGGLWVTDANGINSDSQRVGIMGNAGTSDALTVHGFGTFFSANVSVLEDTLPIAGYTARTNAVGQEAGFDISANGFEKTVEILSTDACDIKFVTDAGADEGSMILKNSGGLFVGGTLTDPTEQLEVMGNISARAVDSGTAKSYFYKNGELARWAMTTNDDAETGSNTGSNWQLDRYDDAGNFIDTPFSIERQSGEMTILKSANFTSGLTKFYSREVTKESFRITLNTLSSDHMQIYSYDDNDSLFKSLYLGGASDTGDEAIEAKANGGVRMKNLPTSATGLTSGDIWRDGEVLKIVP